MLVYCNCTLIDHCGIAFMCSSILSQFFSCNFCKNNFVPHLLIYIKDHRRRKGNTSTKNSETHTLSPSEHSYGKDAEICPSLSADSQFVFGENFEDNSSVKSFESSHDPWMRQSTHNPPTESSDASLSQSVPKTEPSLADMAKFGHKRTASECLTSATEFTFDSMESLDSLSVRNLRSPLSISGDESESGQSAPSLTPDKKRAAFDQ